MSVGRHDFQKLLFREGDRNCDFNFEAKSENCYEVEAMAEKLVFSRVGKTLLRNSL